MLNKFIRVGLIVVMLSSIYCMTCFAFEGKEDRGKDEDKFFKKFHLILENKDMLNLSEDQMQKIMDLKINAKKDVIRNNAEIEIVGLDIKVELKKDKIDLKAVNKLIDKKYDLKKNKAKALAQAYAKLKDILTPEQLAICKEIKEDGFKKYHHGPMGGMMGRPSCPYPKGADCPSKNK